MRSLFATGLITIFSFAAFAQSNPADQITFRVSSNATVLPNSLNPTSGQTCNAETVYGPRLRMRSTIRWEGKGNLVPHAIKLEFNDPNLTNAYVEMLSPNGQNESLAYYYGLTTDYIPADSSPQTFATERCFFDFSLLPRPIFQLKDAQQLAVQVQATLIGVVRDESGNEVPFQKSVPAIIFYVPGSVPLID